MLPYLLCAGSMLAVFQAKEQPALPKIFTDPKSPLYFDPKSPLLVEPTVIMAHSSYLRGVATSPDNKVVVTVGVDRHERVAEMRVWDIATKAHLRSFGSEVCCPSTLLEPLQFESPTKIVTVSGLPGCLEFRRSNLATGEVVLLHRWSGHAHLHAIWADRGRAILARYKKNDGGDGGHDLILIDFESKRSSLIDVDEAFTLLRFSGDRNLVALHIGGKRIAVFNLANNRKVFDGNLAKEINGNSASLGNWFFSKDNKFGYAIMVASNNNNRVEEWDLNTGKKIISVPFSNSGFSPRAPIVMTPDGKRLISCSGSQGWFLDLTTGKTGCAWAMKDKSDFSAQTAYLNPDGRTMVIGATNGRVYIFQLPKIP